jgi:hypothetical protein
MKHSEKEHLKENEVAHALAAASETIGQNRSQVLAIGGAVLAVLVAIGGFLTWQRSKDSTVSGLLADAMVVYEAPVRAAPPGMEGGTGVPAQAPAPIPPRRRSSSPRCRSSSRRPTRRRPARRAVWRASMPHRFSWRSAASTKRRRITSSWRAAPTSSRRARPRQGAGADRAGQFDPAIEGLKALSTQTTAGMPAEGVLMERPALPRRRQGRDARKTLNEIVENTPTRRLPPRRARELDKIKARPRTGAQGPGVLSSASRFSSASRRSASSGVV